MGVTQVIGVYSTGSLRDFLPPGTLVVPDDFICLYPMPTSVSDRPHHITPALDKGLRQDLIRAAEDVEISVRDGGVYWQTAGPRLETKSEIRMMAGVADLVGMTMASEAVLAEEFGMAFAAVCSIDNYAHGIGNEILEDAAIRSRARQSAAGIGRLITLCLERFRVRMRQADKA
jgi:5'-methylthioadenosine phosphorylase